MDECQIDALPQSWAVLSGSGSDERTSQALDALDNRLVDRELSVIKLSDPPFDKSKQSPGYIKGYVPGVRENGGLGRSPIDVSFGDTLGQCVDSRGRS